MASKQPVYNGQPPKYINDFSKALAGEVRILLEDVGKLRDERRQLQYEIAELMSLKSKHGAGGEYSPSWKPDPADIPPPEAPPLPAAIGPAPPAWRTVHKRPERHGKSSKSVAKIAGPPPPPPPPEPVKAGPAWAQWRPNPLLAPAPVVPPPGASMPGTPNARSGLFGPPTPPPK